MQPMRGRSRGRRLSRLALLPLALLLAAAVVPGSSERRNGSLAGMERPGTALRRALEPLRREPPNAPVAAAALAAVARRHPVIADYATRLRAEALLDAERPDDALAVTSVFERDHADSPLMPQVARLRGEAFRAVGDEASARAAWQQALEAERGRASRAELGLEIARSLEQSGDYEAAAERQLELWRRHPTAPGDVETRQAIGRLERRLGRSLLGAHDYVERGDALYAAHHNEAALAAYEEALERRLPRREREAVQRQRAFTLFRLRRYRAAVAAFAALGDESEARFWRARALARVGRIDEAVRAFEALGRGRSSSAMRARFLAGTLLEGEDELERAAAHYDAVAGSRSAAQRAAALWRLGWLAWQRGDAAEAAERFALLAAAYDEPLDQLRARYWQARARERLGEPDALAAYQALALEYPLSYYGWRAADRLVGALPERSPSREPAPAAPDLPPRELARVAALLEAELVSDARAALRALAANARSLGDRLELARLWSEAQELHRAQRTVLDVSRERLARGPEPGLEELWWFAWPRAFESVLGSPPVEPELVWAVMREESGYRASVISPVGARGLLQIMPETGRRLAERVGLDGFDPDLLFRPAVNVRLGAHYLHELLDRFEGRRSAAIASYNAGPAAVERWMRARGELDDDEWIEAIPYDQTRSYVKRVLRSLHAYRVLY